MFGQLHLTRENMVRKPSQPVRLVMVLVASRQWRSGTYQNLSFEYEYEVGNPLYEMSTLSLYFVVCKQNTKNETRWSTSLYIY